MKRFARSAVLAAATLTMGVTPALAASTQILTTALCYDGNNQVLGTLTAYGQGNKATSFLADLSAGTVGGTYTLRHGTKTTASAVVGSAPLNASYDFVVDTSASPVTLTPGRLKTDTFRVNGPGWGETYVDCKI